jgi:acetyl-CoA synthetase
MNATEELRAARDFLLGVRDDYAAARAGFRWPRPAEFNFAVDWFDAVLAAERPDQPGLTLVEEDDTTASYSFATLSRRSNQVAGYLRDAGVGPGTRILLVLGNQVELWETTLAAMKLGAVIIPATTLLSPDDLRDRVDRGAVGAVVTGSAYTANFENVPGKYLRVAVGEPVEGWRDYADAAGFPELLADPARTRAADPLLLYFTSGTTALPKLVAHTNVSYPIGHLSTMYWIGLRPGDVHLNVSSPGWAKHAWSCIFAPWLAGATVCMYNSPASTRARCSTCSRRRG